MAGVGVTLNVSARPIPAQKLSESGAVMGSRLTGKRVAFLVANEGVEQVELTSPWKAVQDEGGEPILVAVEKQPVQAVNHDSDPGDTFDPDLAVGEADEATFDALVLPGGVANPDKLRLVPEAMRFVGSFARSGKPVAAICHGPWSLVEADIVRDKTLTSWPSLRTDITNAGGRWVDEPVSVCRQAGYELVTSRKPDDLHAFDAALIEAFAGSPR